MRTPTFATIALALMAQSMPAQHRGSVEEARSIYERYAGALRAGQRDRLASFYAPEGVQLILDHGHEYWTVAGIDSLYRSQGWQPPVFFAFDDLAFRDIGSGTVLVNGFFRWLRQEGGDTLRVSYAAILQPTPSGLRIRLEHEMTRPPRIDRRLVGTWELVSTRISRNDTTLLEGGPPAVTSLKIINDTHYAVITRRDGQFLRAASGPYELSRDQYSERNDLGSGTGAPGTRTTYTFRLEGDQWVTEGASGVARFRETWRRVR